MHPSSKASEQQCIRATTRLAQLTRLPKAQGTGDAAEKQRCTSETFAVTWRAFSRKVVLSENICSQETCFQHGAYQDDAGIWKTMHLGRHFGGGKNCAHLAGVGLAAVEKSRGKLAVARVDARAAAGGAAIKLRGAAGNAALT